MHVWWPMPKLVNDLHWYRGIYVVSKLLNWYMYSRTVTVVRVVVLNKIKPVASYECICPQLEIVKTMFLVITLYASYQRYQQKLLALLCQNMLATPSEWRHRYFGGFWNKGTTDTYPPEGSLLPHTLCQPWQILLSERSKLSFYRFAFYLYVIHKWRYLKLSYNTGHFHSSFPVLNAPE